ncbi:MAG: hypothetical protein ACPGSO_08695 [Vicingaceae bacterium]
MRLFVLSVFLLSFSFAKAQKDTALFGEWILTKLEINNTVLTPDSGKYKVKISDKEFGFNIDINWCIFTDWKTVENEIITVNQQGGCTKVCCDNENSIYYENLNYTGKYHFLKDNSVLVIENINGIFYLKRSNWSNPDL